MLPRAYMHVISTFPVEDILAVCRLCRRYANDEPVTTAPVPGYPGRTRVVHDGTSLILGEDGTVLAVKIAAEDPPAPPACRAQPSRKRKARRRKPVLRGPSSWTELREWLEQGGYRTDELTGTSHHAVIDQDTKTLIYTLPATASDSQHGLRNAVSDLRRLTGLALRADSSGALI